MLSNLLFIGTTELLLIGGIALLLFGGKKLPEMMKGLGQGVKSFKQGMNEPVGDVEERNEADTSLYDQQSRSDKNPPQSKIHSDGKTA